MAAGVQTVHRDVGHVRNPGEGMVVSAVQRGKCPLQTRRREAIENNRVLVNVILIVVVDEIVAEDGKKRSDGGRAKNKANNKSAPARVQALHFESVFAHAQNASTTSRGGWLLRRRIPRFSIELRAETG